MPQPKPLANTGWVGLRVEYILTRGPSSGIVIRSRLVKVSGKKPAALTILDAGGMLVQRWSGEVQVADDQRRSTIKRAIRGAS